MSLYPEAQDRAQAELMKVVGSSRKPNFKDRSSLPYIEAIFSETLRWGSVAPLGPSTPGFSRNTLTLKTAVPHKSVDDDVYEGLYIPGG